MCITTHADRKTEEMVISVIGKRSIWEHCIFICIFIFSYFDLDLGIHCIARTEEKIHSRCNKWYNISLASLSTNQEPIRSNPPRPSPPHCA